MIRIIEPIDGVAHLFLAGESRILSCVVETDGEEPIDMNGLPMMRVGARWELDVPLEGLRTRLVARCGSEAAVAEVIALETPRKQYRISVDDNIWFLQDIAKNRYDSLFDNPYLALYRDLHERHGVKVHMNIYCECPERGGFGLEEMPDKYLDEWRANRDWLRLSFHAKANLPDQPYLHAGYDRMYEDAKRAMDEIRRFAGDVGRVTTVHFAEATRDGIRALYDLGVRALLGYFTLDESGAPVICYGATRAQSEAVRRHVFWRDPETGMLFFRCDAVLNTLLPERIGPELTRIAEIDPGRKFMDLLIHEQYFYEGTVWYEPDFKERVLAGIRWCEERGFVPGFAEEICSPVLDL